MWLEEANCRKIKKFPFKGNLNKWKKCKKKDVEISGNTLIYKGNADYTRIVTTNIRSKLK